MKSNHRATTTTKGWGATKKSLNGRPWSLCPVLLLFFCWSVPFRVTLPWRVVLLCWCWCCFALTMCASPPAVIRIRNLYTQQYYTNSQPHLILASSWVLPHSRFETVVVSTVGTVAVAADGKSQDGSGVSNFIRQTNRRYDDCDDLAQIRSVRMKVGHPYFGVATMG